MGAVQIPARLVCEDCNHPQKVTKLGRLYVHKHQPAGAAKKTKKARCPGAGRQVVDIPTPLKRNKKSGWYRDPLTGIKLRSVTTILSQGSPKHGLIYWAANLTARTALENLDYLAGADPAEAYEWLRRVHVRVKDDRAALGSAVHHLIEARVLGTPIPETVASDPEMAPYLEHFEQFVADFQVEFTASEMVVANYTLGYAGTLDYLFRSPVIAELLGVDPATEWLGDTKTGGELDVKGVYPEAALQMVAYRNAEICWLADHTRVPMPATAETGFVLHLRPEGYRLIPTACDKTVLDAFLTVQRNAAWANGPAKTVLGDPLHAPAISANEGADHADAA